MIAPATTDTTKLLHMPLTKIGAELEAINKELARRSLLSFTSYTWPSYEVNWHHRVVAAKLDKVLAGECRRLMILEPPQNGKSEQVSRRFPSYALGRRPNLRIIAGSYSDSLAQDMSRDVQRIIDSVAYRELFPGTRLAEASDSEKRTQGQFDVVGKRGYYIATGIMGSMTGKTADLGIIDDPIKNRAEAESETYRERVWEQYKSAFATRQFGSEGAIVICLTRWHEDDLAGRLLRLAEENPDADQWDVLSLPAIAETRQAYDPRQVGEALWPAKYPLEELKRRRAGIGEYDFASLYQQRPAPAGGGLFKREWFKTVDAVPVNARRARGWDTAGTEMGGDWTVGVRVAEADGVFYVEHVVRGQWGPGDVDRIIKGTAQVDGKACVQREEKEGGSAGVAVIATRTKTLVGYDYEGVGISGNKITRARPFRAQCEAGNVRILRGDWNTKYLDELCTFPTGKHDDQVDATSCAFNAVLLEPRPVDACPSGVGSGASYWQGPQ